MMIRPGHTMLALLAGLATAAADEPPRPNLVVVTLSGLDGVGAPAWDLDKILPDPEVRARVTPNLARLAAMGVRFEHAYGGGSSGIPQLGDLTQHLIRAGYAVPEALDAADRMAPHQTDPGQWPPRQGGLAVRNWRRLTPTQGSGRRAKEDLSVEAWERLVQSQEAQQAATQTAAHIITREDQDSPTLVACSIESGQHTRTAGVFFDRFPLDQIVIPADDYELRTLAVRMGQSADEAAALATDPEAWKRAIQAWFANASALDYAAGKIVDAVEAANTDDDPANDWAIVLAAPPSAEGVGEIASRADLLLTAPGVTEPGQQIATPVSLSQVAMTIARITNVYPAGIDWSDLKAPVRDPPAALQGESLLPLLERAGERYDVVAITAAADSLGVRSHRFRLIHGAGGTQSLYDLVQDPAGLTDLLDPNSAASINGFGLSPTQVESVREWLGWKLVQRLEKPAQVGTNRDPKAAIASLQEAGIFEPPADYTAPMPGDFNRDGVVDAADKTLFRDTQGDEVPVGSGADADHDGRIGDADGEIWRANYGRRAEVAKP